MQQHRINLAAVQPMASFFQNGMSTAAPRNGCVNRRPLRPTNEQEVQHS